MEEWTDIKYTKFCLNVRAVMKSEGLEGNHEAAYDVAKGLFFYNYGLEEFMKNEMGVTDIVSRLASDI